MTSLSLSSLSKHWSGPSAPGSSTVMAGLGLSIAYDCFRIDNKVYLMAEKIIVIGTKQWHQSIPANLLLQILKIIGIRDRDWETSLHEPRNHGLIVRLLFKAWPKLPHPNFSRHNTYMNATVPNLWQLALDQESRPFEELRISGLVLLPLATVRLP
ncbi:hypothetical protein VNO77_22938 [Canavalia gladiata]|uniref:Uncharacterized protein n=1 Tax=Canavalia gladiata TaxID=3824 RepID=A0AAN9L416_CANGL